jgi:DNA-binding NarL/FixJ family response regulator
VRILLIDDHALVREGLRTLLEGGEEGIEVVGEAATTDEGLNTALALAPDLILLDLSLPGRPAPELIRSVRSALPRTHVVVLSAMIEERWVRETVAAGASGYLLKQLTRRDLVAAIEGALAGRQVFHPEARKFLLSAAGSGSD